MAFLIKRTYKVTLPDGAVEQRECETWTIRYRDGSGKTRDVKAYRDKAASKQKMAQLELQLARGEQGMVDPYKAHRRRPITDHLADWVADLRSAGRSEKYVRGCNWRMKLLITATGWETLRDVEPNGFLRWRDKAKKTPRNGTEKGDKPRAEASARTLNAYLDTAQAFLNWCVKNRRVATSALADVAKAEGEAARKRRALTDEQVATLLAVAPEGRKLVYRFGLATGLRRSEIKALKWGDVRLLATKPYVQLRAEATKARRGDRVQLPQSLAEDLRKHKLADARDDDAVFVVPSLVWWKIDLKAADIPYKDAMGRQVDFHGGTRKTLCTRLHRNNVPLATAMRVMRHTDARLTLIDYTDDEQVGLVEALPEIVATATATAAPAKVAAAQ